MADSHLTDALGDEVVVLDRTWYGHIVRRRPEMRRYRSAVESIVTSPMVVLRGLDDEGHQTGRVYVGRCPDRNLLIKVCVGAAAVDNQPVTIVKTAYLCRKTGPGEQIWP